MDGMEIINSFKKETFYEFSEAIPVLLIKNSANNTENLISHIDIEPIAYILKTETNDKTDYQIESIDERYDSFIEENKNNLLEEFLNNES